MSGNIILNSMAPNIPDICIASLSDLLPENRIYSVFPGFCDVHVHFREPGFAYKETIGTGCASAARGGYTAVCTMPNLDPVPDSKDALQKELKCIKEEASIAVYPYGSITVGEKGEVLADIAGLAESVIAFSDDGKGIQREDVMYCAMKEAKKYGKIIAAHTEDDTLANGGYVHEGIYSKTHGHKGISSESEWRQIERDLGLARETGCSYHVCHISCRESVGLIRTAKAEGVDVSCETAPHYLLLHDEMLADDGRFKMKPPIRSLADRDALIEGIIDGTIDMIATDHAPHSADEKSGGLKDSVSGIVGFETAFPLLFTYLVKPGIISLEKLISLMAYQPRKRFCIPEDDGFSIWDLNAIETINPDSFLSKGKSTPFAGAEVSGICMLTALNGLPVYKYSQQN